MTYSLTLKMEATCSSEISVFLQDYTVLYCQVSGECMTIKAGFGFDDRTYWTLIQLLVTVVRYQGSA
jgi:hypothetical protein